MVRILVRSKSMCSVQRISMINSTVLLFNTPVSALTDTSILYTDRLTHGQTDTWMDRKADSSLPLKTFILPRDNKKMFTNMGMNLFLLHWKKDLVKRNMLKQDFLRQIGGNNSFTLDRIFTKFASCTSTTPNENICQVLSESDRNCRRSYPDKHF